MLTIPYEAQERSDGCAAAALAMVYRSLGIDCSQTELWPRITAPVRGVPRGKTHLLCRDALSRGLDAVIIRAASPWSTLLRCFNAGVRVVLHHRHSLAHPGGHYSVLVELDDTEIRLHDPAQGPGHRLPRELFLHLWTLGFGEVVGRVLVAIHPPTKPIHSETCQHDLPESITCVSCGGTIRLRPAEALGCPVEGCPNRLWAACYCPWCDMSTWWLKKPGFLVNGGIQI